MTNTQTSFLSSVVDAGVSGVETVCAVWLGVDVSYSDATDVYPALNSLPGFDAAVSVCCAVLGSPCNAYSTTMCFDSHSEVPVWVGVQMTQAYAEVDRDSYVESVCTWVSGSCVGSASNFEMLVGWAPFHSKVRDESSATMAYFGHGGQMPTVDRSVKAMVACVCVLYSDATADGGANVEIVASVVWVGVNQPAVGSHSPCQVDTVVVAVVSCVVRVVLSFVRYGRIVFRD